MSAATEFMAAELGWLSMAEFRELGFEVRGPEVDYGMAWGVDRGVRVSLAPAADGTTFLYARNRNDDRYLLLAPSTTRQAADDAWQQLVHLQHVPDAYLAFAGLAEPDAAMDVASSRRLLEHCVRRELDAYGRFRSVSEGGRVRFDAAGAVVVQRSARVAAEDLHIDALRRPGAEEPVIVRYRLLGDASWRGRAPGACLGEAIQHAELVRDRAAAQGLTLQATSVSHGHTVVSAHRVKSLKALTPTAVRPVGAPPIAL